MGRWWVCKQGLSLRVRKNFFIKKNFLTRSIELSFFLFCRLLEPCAVKVTRTVLTGGKFEKTYLSGYELLYFIDNGLWELCGLGGGTLQLLLVPGLLSNKKVKK